MIHRVKDIEERGSMVYFKTKGDNNISYDTGWTPGHTVIGKLVLSIPFLGHLSMNTLFRALNLLLIAFLIFLIFYIEA